MKASELREIAKEWLSPEYGPNREEEGVARAILVLLPVLEAAEKYNRVACQWGKVQKALAAARKVIEEER